MQGLSDVVSGAGLALYAEVALVIFFLLFVGIVIYVFSKHNKARYERAKLMPLDDDQPQQPRAAEQVRGGSRGDVATKSDAATKVDGERQPSPDDDAMRTP